MCIFIDIFVLLKSDHLTFRFLNFQIPFGYYLIMIDIINSNLDFAKRYNVIIILLED